MCVFVWFYESKLLDGSQGVGFDKPAIWKLVSHKPGVAVWGEILADKVSETDEEYRLRRNEAGVDGGRAQAKEEGQRTRWEDPESWGYEEVIGKMVGLGGTDKYI